jgi:hypothetical protein
VGSISGWRLPTNEIPHDLRLGRIESIFSYKAQINGSLYLGGIVGVML